MIEPDEERVQAAVDRAFDDAVSMEFKNLFANLMDATQGAMTPDESERAFIRGMRVAWTAYQRACAAANKMMLQ